MNELQKIREKYKNRDLIEIGFLDVKKAVEWTLSEQVENVLYWKEEYGKKLKSVLDANNGFVQFLQKGIIIIRNNLNHIKEGFFSNTPGAVNITKTNIEVFNYYPFEFTEEGLLLSIIIEDPKDNELKTTGKILVSFCGNHLNVAWKELNEDLYDSHYSNTIRDPHVIGRTAYLKHISNVQFLIVACVNLYLVLHQKNILISRIEQTRTLTASEKKKKSHKKINPFYRYAVRVPDNYKPRKFDVNYILDHWGRSGHTATRWVLLENAGLLAERCKGQVLWETQVSGKVKILRKIAPQTVHRRIGTKTGETQAKVYSNLVGSSS